ncbi:MAG: hypothetical protein M3442_14635 [Chloroflexota bacterium]|nr:hypothetical protein [Chloroflexota bacterium]
MLLRRVAMAVDFAFVRRITARFSSLQSVGARTQLAKLPGASATVVSHRGGEAPGVADAAPEISWTAPHGCRRIT